MKRFLCLIFFVLIALPVFAQTAPDFTGKFGAAGIGYFSTNTPDIQGWAALGIPLTSDTKKAIAYTDMKIGASKEGTTTVAGQHVVVQFNVGFAYNLANITNTWSLWGLAAPGFVANGNSISSAFEYGGFVHKSVGKGWGVILALTAEKSVGATDFAPRLGITKKF